MKGIYRLLLQSTAVFVAAYCMPSVFLTHYGYAVLVALILAIVNVTVKPVLNILALPVTLMTLGLFLLVINALMVMLVDYLMDDFSVRGFWNAMFFSIIISIIYWVLDAIFGSDKK